MIDPDDYDCVNCGACCVSDYDAKDYVRVSEEDLTRLTAEEQRFYVVTDNEFGAPQRSMQTAYDKAGNCRCKALEGSIGGQVACSIYENRPNVCRKFAPETIACDYARRAAFGVSDQ